MDADDVIHELNKFVADKSRSRSSTLTGLRDISEELQSCIDALIEEGVKEEE